MNVEILFIKKAIFLCNITYNNKLKKMISIYLFNIKIFLFLLNKIRLALIGEFKLT